MRKMTAMVAITMAAAVWFIAPVAKPKFAGKVENAPEPLSPHQIMSHHRRSQHHKDGRDLDALEASIMSRVILPTRSWARR